jgi:hypothetical protein
MDTSDHNRVELTLWIRIEEIQGQEEVDSRACIKEKGMYGLLHGCKKTGVWERALECERIEAPVRNVESHSPDPGRRMQCVPPPNSLVLDL